MRCPVTISTAAGVSSPDDLVRQALNASTIDLTIRNEIGEELPLKLTENRDTIDTNRLHVDSTSTLVSHCHFNGVYKGQLSAVSLCDPKTINGVIVLQSNHFILDVRKRSFFLLPQSDQSCKFVSRLRRAATNGNGPRLPSYYAEYNDGKTRYVELALVADFSIYEKYEKDAQKVNDRLQSIAHIVNSLYFPLNVRISLVHTEIWKDGDKFAVATSGDKTLENFLGYRKTILKDHPNDNAHMLTNVHFEAGVVGKAYKGTMCSYDYSGGVDVDHSTNAAAVAATIAHEMGHNFGMEHDADYDSTCTCPNAQKHCIMAAVTGNPPPTLWSDCSLQYITRGFTRGMDLCLKNPPEKSVGTAARCGNGIVERGEECDCGGECLNNCCDGKTCKLIGEAKCAEGECCDLNTCKPKERATQCRSASNICDLPEYCNGQTTDCPADFFVQNGHLCPGKEDAFCYEGVCGSRDDQCLDIWGASSKSSVEQCYNQNVYGIVQGNCGYDPHSQEFTKCLQQDVMCGRLQCETLAERPKFGDPSTVQPIPSKLRIGNKEFQCNSIKTTFVGKQRADPGMVNDGSVCGKDKICVDAKCQERKDVNKTVSQCNDNCHWRGICNNVGNCHCENGFGGVACEIPGYGGSVNSNTANLHRGITPSVMFLVLFAIFGIGFITACIYYKVKRKRNILHEIWVYSKKSLNLHGTLVPVRKAPAPPSGQRPKRMSFTAMWGDSSTVTYTASPRNQAQTYVPPNIPIMTAGSPSPVEHEPPRKTKSKLARVPSNRPKDPPPMVPVRPHPMALAKIYDDQFCDLEPDKPLPPVPQELEYPMPENKTAKVSRTDSLRPTNPPPPPPSTSKPKKSGAPPPLPKEGPKVNEDTGKLDVKKMAALFDSKRKSDT